MLTRTITLALAALAALAATAAQADTLSTGTGDGKVAIDTNAYGRLSSGTANYDPVGPLGAASTIYRSELYARTGTGSRTLVQGQLTSFTGTDTSRTSVFAFDQFEVTLVQSLTDLIDNGVQTGARLNQAYSFRNTGTTAATLNLVRYIDGDLDFDQSIDDAGGVRLGGTSPLLFETDSASGPNETTTFLGLYNEGGVGSGYQIAQYSDLLGLIQTGVALNGTIGNDTNSDGFVDTAYDLALGLSNDLSVGAGQSASFTTYTLFGSGAPGAVSVPGAVPEPASWAMMLGGFGLIGGTLRASRRKAQISFG